MIDLAIIVVSWNTRQLTLEALRSLYADLALSRLEADVYVVDNASVDGSAEALREYFPQVKLIASEENLGFVRANNLAMEQIGFGQADAADLPRAVYLLNSDTVTQPGATAALFDLLMSCDDIGLVGARLTYGDESFQHSAFQFPGLRQLWVEFFPTPGRFIEGTFNGRYPRSFYESEEPFPVDFVLGATMMLKAEVIQQTGMFDEALFMYCEEIDWAWRIHRAGWKVYCVPAAHVVHLGGQSTSQVRARSLIYLWKSRLLIFRRYYPAWKYQIARVMIALGMRLKMRKVRHNQSLPEPERVELLDAYRHVYQLALHPEQQASD